MNEDSVLKTEESILSDARRAMRESIKKKHVEPEANKKINDSNDSTNISQNPASRQKQQELVNLNLKDGGRKEVRSGEKVNNNRLNGPPKVNNNGPSRANTNSIQRGNLQGNSKQQHKYKGLSNQSPNQVEEIIRHKRSGSSNENMQNKIVANGAIEKKSSEIKKKSAVNREQNNYDLVNGPFSSERSQRADQYRKGNRRSNSTGRELSKGSKKRAASVIRNPRVNESNNNHLMVIDLEGGRRESKKSKANSKVERKGVKRKITKNRKSKPSCMQTYNTIAIHALPFLFCISSFSLLNFFDEWITENETFYNFNSYSDSINSLTGLDVVPKKDDIIDDNLCKSFNNFSLNMLMSTNKFFMKIYIAKKAILITNLSFAVLSLLFFWFRTSKNVNKCFKFYLGTICFIILKPAWWVSICTCLSGLNLALFPFFHFYMSSYKQENILVTYINSITQCFEKTNKIQVHLTTNMKIFEISTQASPALFYIMILSGVYQFHLLISCLINKFAFKIRIFKRYDLC